MAGILTLQKQAIKSLIQSMTIMGGFNNDWSVVNNLNLAIGGFPRAEVYRPKEQNLDPIGGISSLDYTNRVTYRIVVDGELPFSSDNPVFDIEDVFSDAVDDLKMLFGRAENRSVPIMIDGVLVGTMDSFLYNNFTQEYKSTDQFIPTRLVTEWYGVYSQDRMTPTQYSGS